MSIRAARPGDAPDVREVASLAWHAAHGDILGAEAVDRLLDDWYAVDDIRTSIERGRSPMFVADGADGLVGFAQGGPSEEGPADAVVSRIYVRPDRWGEGHGTRLLDRLCATLRADGHESIWLAVLAENEVGRAFYRARGFSRLERRTVVLAGQEIEDVVLTRAL